MAPGFISKSSISIVILAILFAAGWYIYKLPKFDDGEMAPDFVSYTPDGDSLRLSDFNGKLVLLDFWGSWCPPCRVESPSLVRLYDKYRGKTFKNASSFEILSVGIETSKAAWTKAINADNLHWPHHVSSIKRLRDPVAKLYGVKEIPTKYLVNEKGMIVAANPTFEEIDQWLADRVK